MKSGRVQAAVAIYAVLGATGWWLATVFVRTPWGLGRPALGPRWLTFGSAIALGAALGVALVGTTRWLVRRTRWANALTRELREGLLGMRTDAALPLAIASALGEELFFRGFVQTLLVGHLGAVAGVLAASTLFGAAHIPWNRRLAGWTVMAWAIGVVFGTLVVATGELVVAIVAHGVINYFNLRFMLALDPPPVVLPTRRVSTST